MVAFSLERSTVVVAPPARVHGLVDTFPAWQSWSPWEGIDPDLHREYSGPAQGTGARYRWSGNKKAGEGTMEIVSSTPERIEVALEFLRPFAARNTTTFTFTPEPAAGGTRVTWTMTGERGPAMALAGRLFFDRAIGRDFERGLAALRTAAAGT